MLHEEQIQGAKSILNSLSDLLTVEKTKIINISLKNNDEDSNCLEYDIKIIIKKG
jgi:hypothetical protein